MISHRHIEVFRAVMTAGGVTGAAALLHTSQPTISRELARLEQLLGYALFERQRGRLKATARALALFDEVQRAYEGLERVIARAGALGRAEGERLAVLSLPALDQTLLPAASRAFMAAHPGASLSITPQESPLLEEWMSAQRFDDPYRQQLDAMFAAKGVDRLLQIETHSAAAVCAMVEQGLGIAIVNPLTALAWSSERLQLRRLSVSVPFRVNALLPEHRAAQPLVAAYIACIKLEVAALRERLAKLG
jgi:DNA-binding transcriptional LysR family regulator